MFKKNIINSKITVQYFEICDLKQTHPRDPKRDEGVKKMDGWKTNTTGVMTHNSAIIWSSMEVSLFSLDIFYMVLTFP